jgi:hypothetical protein
VFHIDVEILSACGGTFNLIDCIEDPEIIDKILT